jgi:Cell wall-active antibiotics response 4TMS YvqF
VPGGLRLRGRGCDRLGTENAWGAATTEADLAEVVRALPPLIPMTSPESRLAQPLEINSGFGRLRLARQWQVARETHVSAQLGNVRIDLTEAEFDDHIIDLHVYSGWGRITIIVPRGVAVQVIRHRGGVRSRLEPPVPGLPAASTSASARDAWRIIPGLVSQ